VIEEIAQEEAVVAQEEAVIAQEEAVIAQEEAVIAQEETEVAQEEAVEAEIAPPVKRTKDLRQYSLELPLESKVEEIPPSEQFSKFFLLLLDSSLIFFYFFAERTQKEIRLFLSSTFDDQGAERTEFQKNVFPSLKNYCASFGWSFQVRPFFSFFTS